MMRFAFEISIGRADVNDEEQQQDHKRPPT